MAKKTTSAAEKARFAVYSSSLTWKTNREASLKRHLAKNPDDAVAQAALKALAGKTKPRRAGFKTKPRLAGFKAKGVNRDSGRLVAQISRLVKGALNADKFQLKAQAKEKTAKAAKGVKSSKR